MTIKYFYGLVLHATRVEAEAAKAAREIRLQSNPSDWMVVKQITGSDDAGWTMHPTLLTDAQILNIDVNGNYCTSSPVHGENAMPLTATQLTEKVSEYRQAYKDQNFYNDIVEVEVGTGKLNG
mgnify:CR=1 FL=1|tara:strand:+ start:1000 stop:1368 length:369 start_codon:yes stop_codon:yes gene_type:complete